MPARISTVAGRGGQNACRGKVTGGRRPRGRLPVSPSASRSSWVAGHPLHHGTTTTTPIPPQPGTIQTGP
jgi:hypothetical protein